MTFTSFLRRIFPATLLSRARALQIGLGLEGNLPQLAAYWHTDKWGGGWTRTNNPHWYAQHYQHHFRSRRFQKLTVLEIGIGGYDNPTSGGASLRMWQSYFPNSLIVGIDIHDKSPHADKRIQTFQGSQADVEFLRKVNDTVGGFDIIIDDGSHQSDHVITTFEALFPLLRPHGIYAIEDLQTSYWSGFGGVTNDVTAPTSMNYLKKLADGLNYAEFDHPGYTPTYFDRHIIALHFYHNLIFINKGQNNEGSNIVVDNQLPEQCR